MNALLLNEKCIEILKAVQKDVEGSEKNSWSNSKAHSLFGYLCYYIAGRDSAESAKKVIELYCERLKALDERVEIEDVHLLIQNAYSIARNIADGSSLDIDRIVEAHAESICKSNSWNNDIKKSLEKELIDFYSFIESGKTQKDSLTTANEEKANYQTIDSETTKSVWYKNKGIAAMSILSGILLITVIALSYNLFSANTEESGSIKHIQELQKEIRTLEPYKAAAEEYDEYAVIVVPDVDNHYHRIRCSRLPDEYEYWTYNVEAAKEDGYSKCPDCIDEDFDEYVRDNYTSIGF